VTPLTLKMAGKWSKLAYRKCNHLNNASLCVAIQFMCNLWQ